MYAWQLEFWHWWALGLILVVLEALAPSGFFAALAIAAAITGAAFLMYPELGWQQQLLILGTLTVILYYLIRALFRKYIAAQEQSNSKKAGEFIGQEFELTYPMRNGYGEHEIDGQIWSLKGPELNAGTRVRVVGTDGDMLAVFPVPRKKTDPEADQGVGS